MEPRPQRRRFRRPQGVAIGSKIGPSYPDPEAELSFIVLVFVSVVISVVIFVVIFVVISAVMVCHCAVCFVAAESKHGS